MGKGSNPDSALSGKYISVFCANDNPCSTRLATKCVNMYYCAAYLHNRKLYVRESYWTACKEPVILGP